MAQPQHTRNEPHSSDAAAILEGYTEARATGATNFKFDGQTLQADAVPPLPLAENYPIPRFNRYSDYWSTASGADSLSIGKGLADYSSRGFFTPLQSLGDPGNAFPRPANTEGAYTVAKNTPTGGNACPGLVLGFPEYAWGSVDDSVTGTPTKSVRMASRGLIPSKWTISRCVLIDQGNLLIPRAVAYSAGLIDYFFRGRLEITPPAEGIYSLVDHFDFSGANAMPTAAESGFKGFKTIKLNLRNATPDISPSGGGTPAPQTMQSGNLVAVLKFYRNKSYIDNLSGEPAGNDTAAYTASRSMSEEIVVSSRVKDGGGNVLTAPIGVANVAQTFIFEFDQELPINATDVKLQVVYRGTLGSEADAVVVETVDVSEPTHFAYVNSTDYIKVDGVLYTRENLNTRLLGDAALRAKIQPASCIKSTTLALDDQCFVAKDLIYPLAFPNGTPIGQVSLPVRTYHRISALTQAGATWQLNFGQTAQCGPQGIDNVLSALAQTTYTPNASGGVDTNLSVTGVQTARGIRGYPMENCIFAGDGNTAVTQLTDTQRAALSPLPTGNLTPKQMTGFQFGATP